MWFNYSAQKPVVIFVMVKILQNAPFTLLPVFSIYVSFFLYMLLGISGSIAPPSQWPLVHSSPKRAIHFHPMFLTTAASCLYSLRMWDGTPNMYNRHLTFDVAVICNTLSNMHLWLACMTFKLFFGQSSPQLQMLPCEVSYVYESIWRWKWFFCQSSFVIQWLRLCRTSDTVLQCEINSRQQWDYKTYHGDSFPSA